MTSTPPPGWKLQTRIGEIWRRALPATVLQGNITRDEVIDYVGLLADKFVDAIEHIDKLNARIKVLEARPELKYCGVWSADKVFGQGNFVTDSGSLWHASRANIGERPGSGDAWQLAVKKGRDAR